MVIIFSSLKSSMQILICTNLRKSEVSQPNLLLLFIMLLISRSKEDTYVWLINCRLHLFRSSASSFSSQYLLLFLKSSRSCVCILPPLFISIICPSMASWTGQFLLRIWPNQLAFQCKILFRSDVFSPIRSRTCSLVTFSDHFIFSILLQHHIQLDNQTWIQI